MASGAFFAECTWPAAVVAAGSAMRKRADYAFAGGARGDCARRTEGTAMERMRGSDCSTQTTSSETSKGGTAGGASRPAMLYGQRSSWEGAGDAGMPRVRSEILTKSGRDVHSRSTGPAPVLSAGIKPRGMSARTRMAAASVAVNAGMRTQRVENRFMQHKV